MRARIIRASGYLREGGNFPARQFSPKERRRATSRMQPLRLLLPEPPVLIVKGVFELRETSDRIPSLTSIGSARTTGPHIVFAMMLQLPASSKNQYGNENYKKERLPQEGNLPMHPYSLKERRRTTSGRQPPTTTSFVPEPPVLIAKGVVGLRATYYHELEMQGSHIVFAMMLQLFISFPNMVRTRVIRASGYLREAASRYINHLRTKEDELLQKGNHPLHPLIPELLALSAKWVR
jgi:hypothetical protein